VSITFRRPPEQRAPLELLVDNAFTFQVDAYEDDLPVTVTSATVTVEQPGGTDIVTSANATVAAGDDGSTTNRVTYQLSAGNIDTLDTNYKAIFSVTISGAVYQHIILYDVVRTHLQNTVTESDLLQMSPALMFERSLFIEEGTADSGSSTTLVDAQLQEYPDDFFNGGEVSVLSGTNEGEVREVTDFARSTGTVTVGVAFPSAVDTTSVYRLRASWQSLLDRAFDQVKWRVRSLDRRPALILDAGELHLPILYKALQFAHEAVSSLKGEGTDGSNWEKAQEYMGKADDAFRSTDFRYDPGEDIVVTDELEFGVVKVHRR